MAVGPCWELKALRIQQPECLYHPFPLSLTLAWELTGDEMLAGLVDFSTMVTTVSVGPKGFWYDWAACIVQADQIAHVPMTNVSGG